MFYESSTASVSLNDGRAAIFCVPRRELRVLLPPRIALEAEVDVGDSVTPTAMWPMEKGVLSSFAASASSDSSVLPRLIR